MRRLTRFRPSRPNPGIPKALSAERGTMLAQAPPTTPVAAGTGESQPTIAGHDKTAGDKAPPREMTTGDTDLPHEITTGDESFQGKRRQVTQGSQ